MHENKKILSKEYKATPVALMRNHQSRKSGTKNPRSKTVWKLSMDGELLATYESMNQAAHKNKTFHVSISKCCNHPLQLFHAGGFRWCFEYNLTSFRQRCRHVVVMRQLCEKISRSEPRIIAPQPCTDATRTKIGQTMKEYFATDEGRQNKRDAHKKRSETMSARREQVRSTIIDKQCRMCEKIQPVAMFCKKSASVDGLQAYCGPCINVKKQPHRSFSVMDGTSELQGQFL
jgi:hypothetical protein